ncbi:LolA-related protein [Belnapia moabensis]|uniref:LolA-related protein n=1 Tax=Belnapia moabensis TaxID=365533 RepID=UPI0009FC3A00|nr:LolA-related protein [Belnapia moabensis]
MRWALLLLLALAMPARAEDPALLRLMQGFAAQPRSEARFTEDKVIPELDLPLPSQGLLRWQAPDRLEKHTTSPIDEMLRVEGGRLLYERPDRGIRREFGLEEQPEMRALVEAVRGTLAGDLATLHRYYEIGFTPEGAGTPWRMVLSPLSIRLRAAVQRITVSGRGAQVRSIETEGGGGVTRMQISP